MKWNRSVLTTSLLGLMLPLTCQSASTPTEINVDFTATVTETTCAFIIDTTPGYVKEDTEGSHYTLTIPNVGLDKIISKDATAQKDFTIKAKGCSNGVGSITTKISGSKVDGNLIKNGLTSTGAATNICMGFKRQTESGENFVKPDNAATITWSSNEITNGLPMTVALREGSGSGTTAGDFDATATFNFTYN